MTTYVMGTSLTLTLDLSDLPGGLDLIPRLNTDRYLDIATENGTRVDYARLEIETCQKIRYDFSLRQTPFVAGRRRRPPSTLGACKAIWTNVRDLSTLPPCPSPGRTTIR